MATPHPRIVPEAQHLLTNRPFLSSISPRKKNKAWRAAVAFYAKDLAQRDLLLNGEMETINNRLSEMETCADLQGKTSPPCRSGLQTDLVEALDRAAPVLPGPLVGRTGSRKPRMDCPGGADGSTDGCRAFRAACGRLPAPLAGRAAARGHRVVRWTLRRLYIAWPHTRHTFQPRRTQSRIYGFEVLFHEGSHALAGAVNEAIAREFRTRDKPIPRDLWHALLFTPRVNWFAAISRTER